MKPNTNNILFSGRANNPLYTRIVDYIAYTAKLGRGVKGDVNITSFAGGETYCQYKHNIRGKDIFIIQSTDDPNENWMELFLLIHAAKLASANKITAVIPYYSYARQDRKTEARCPISARLMLDLLKEAGATRIITVDIHNLSVQGMSSMPLDSLLPCNILLDYVRNTLLPTCPKNNWTIVSPDVGGAKKIEKYMSKIRHKEYPPSINEIAFARKRPSKVLGVEMTVEDTVLKFAGDGVMISTPNGSTAYNASAGGSIIDPELQVFSVTPLYPFYS